MRQPIKFLAVLVAGLGLLTWGAFLVMQVTMRDWVERDYRRAGRMLRDAARLRRRERLFGRLNVRFSTRFTGVDA